MNSLPIEILTTICRHLTFSDRKSFSLVSIRFYQSTYCRDLWENVTFVFGKIISLPLNTHFLNILTNIKFFSVDICPGRLSEILKYTHNLTQLELIICPNLFRDNAQLNFYFHENICDEVRNVLKNLRSLNVSGNKATITDCGFNSLLRQCHNLRSIDLSELEIESVSPENDSNDRFLSSNNRRIVRLPSTVNRIRSDRLTFANIITQLQPLATSLVEIKLCSTPLGYDDLFDMATMPDLHLTTIELDNCKNVDLRTIQMIIELQNASLTKISLLNTVPIIMMNSLCPTMERFEKIRIRGQGHQAMNIIPNALANGKLSINHLHLEYCSVDDKFISSLNELHMLKKLHLLGCNFSALQQSRIAIPHLRELNLSRSYGFLHDDFIESILSLTQLEHLLLDWVKMSDSTVAGVSCLTQLQTVSLIGCVSVSSPVLADGLAKLWHLRILRVQGLRNIDDRFLDTIVGLANRLEEIDLSGSQVSDGALVDFVGRAFRLRKLRLDNCGRITAQLVDCLPRVCPYLQDVSMRNCDHIENPIALNYYDSLFLHECPTDR